MLSWGLSAIGLVPAFPCRSWDTFTRWGFLLYFQTHLPLWGAGKFHSCQNGPPATPVSKAITPSFQSIHYSKEHCYRPSHLGQCCWLNSSPLGHRWPMIGYSNVIRLRGNGDPFRPTSASLCKQPPPRGSGFARLPLHLERLRHSEGPS